MESKTDDFTLTMETTIRLLKVEKAAATVELIQRVYSGDTLVSAQTAQKGVPARVDADLGIVKETEETLEVAGRKLACRRADVRREVGGVPYKMRFWTCGDVPGGTVRSEGGPAGEKAPSNRMTALEWRKVTATGIQEVSTRAEGEELLKKVEDTLVRANTLRFDYARTFNGEPLKGRFAREGDRLFFTFTSERKVGGPLTHTRISDGKAFLLSVNSKKVEPFKVSPGLGANAVAVMLYGVPESLDPWSNVEEGKPLKSTVELSDVRIRGREKTGDVDATVVDTLRTRSGDPRNREYVTVWIDARRAVPLKRLVIQAGAEPDYAFRLEETFSDFEFDKPLDPSTFQVPE